MGWYTTDAGDLRYKYGNVHQLAGECGIGKFTIAPRLDVELTNGDNFYHCEFLSDFQDGVEELGLPWKHVDLSADEIIADPNQSIKSYIKWIQDIVVPHIKSIEKFIAENEEDAKISSITAGTDLIWELDKKDWPEFVKWLNAPLSKPLTLEIIKEGNEGDDESWYHLPEEYEEQCIYINPVTIPRLKSGL